MRSGLDAAATRAWVQSAARDLATHRAEIDALNVFPVPDSDTGTNLAQTFAAAALAAVECAAEHAGEVLNAAAAAAVLSARGNSGVIAAQLLRSLAVQAAGSAVLGAVELTTGLNHAVTDTYSAVADPVEGTMLTVVRAAADAAAPGLSIAELAVAVVRAAENALWHTTEQLAPLARAGVIDAGGLGLLVVLDALAETITGAKVSAPRDLPVGRPAALLHAQREMGSSEYEYEVQYLLDAPAGAIEALRQRLSEIGDSVIVVGTGLTDESLAETWNVHAHVSDVGAAIEAGLAAGRAHRISVVSFANEALAGAEAIRAGARPAAARLLVVVGPEAGTEQLFTVEGVQLVREAPAPERFVATLGELDVAEAIVLHAEEHAQRVGAASALARRAGIRVGVIPVRSAMQGLAAVAIHDPARDFDDDVVAMAEAAAATRFGEVSVADEDGLTSVGACVAGDVLGLIDGEIVEIGKDVTDVALSLTDRVLGVGAELITLLVGADAPAGLGETIATHVRARAPFTEVTVYAGGQAGRPLVIGIE